MTQVLFLAGPPGGSSLLPAADMTEATPSRRAILVLIVTVEGSLVVLAWALGWQFDQPLGPQLSGSWLDILLGVATALPLLLIAFTLLRWPIGPFAALKRFTQEVICPLLYPCTRTDLLGISVLAGLGEELLFRGVLQPVLMSWLGINLGLAAASVLFGLLHAATFTYALFAGLLGALLGWLALVRENLLAPIVAHALYDFVILLYLLYGPGLPAELRKSEENDAVQ